MRPRKLGNQIHHHAVYLPALPSHLKIRYGEGPCLIATVDLAFQNQGSAGAQELSRVYRLGNLFAASREAPDQGALRNQLRHATSPASARAADLRKYRMVQGLRLIAVSDLVLEKLGSR
jgi:hypothetical protein